MGLRTDSSAFDVLWTQLKMKGPSGSFDYISPNTPFRGVVHAHFRNGDRRGMFGVYVLRRAGDDEVLYVGKGGTLRPDGTFKRQDMRGRLTAVRGDIGSDRWFAAACSDCGALRIEYVFLTAVPVSPALAEAQLLQAFLNENGRLPLYNRGF